ncbi:LOG family protein [Alteribacillus iranensis]|uniref:Cytokinin riboside 5'-monophosphate phosphoribohydrolase n=1 Tax=Alteribacillus iranensis TaxID=930128 RepID=A0A1I1Z2T6_9BACI|nr:TIGR00730 family Rossman fold protein [Alteribacillus iranensis]SFE26126.1 hypothetical protein SAMN05192532_10113 [Alteribacillus iranensis]
MKSLTVFCGSSEGNELGHVRAAKKFGQIAASYGVEIVYGGSSTGLMGAIADGALNAGGKVTGIIPEDLMPREIAHQNLTQLISVKSMHERKMCMYERGHAFVALPGGIGTLEEFMEVLTWGAVGHHHKPCALYNVDHYYDPLKDLLEHMVEQGFLARTVKENIIIEDDPDLLLSKLIGIKEEN